MWPLTGGAPLAFFRKASGSISGPCGTRSCTSARSGSYYDEKTATGYTWRIHFGDTFGRGGRLRPELDTERIDLLTAQFSLEPGGQ